MQTCNVLLPPSLQCYIVPNVKQRKKRRKLEKTYYPLLRRLLLIWMVRVKRSHREWKRIWILRDMPVPKAINHLCLVMHMMLDVLQHVHHRSILLLIVHWLCLRLLCFLGCLALVLRAPHQMILLARCLCRSLRANCLFLELQYGGVRSIHLCLVIFKLKCHVQATSLSHYVHGHTCFHVQKYLPFYLFQSSQAMIEVPSNSCHPSSHPNWSFFGGVIVPYVFHHKIRNLHLSCF